MAMTARDIKLDVVKIVAAEDCKKYGVEPGTAFRVVLYATPEAAQELAHHLVAGARQSARMGPAVNACVAIAFAGMVMVTPQASPTIVGAVN